MGTDLRNDIQNIKFALTELLNVLNKVNSENFEELFPLANELSGKIIAKREELRQHYPEETLKKYNAELDFVLKEIDKKSDNVLLDLKTKQQKVAQQLKNSLNQKNLAKYR